MSKTAIQTRPGKRVKSRLQIQKPELSASDFTQRGMQRDSLGLFYKLLLISAYCLSALTFCLVVTA
jgi:hypothetical protein